MMNLCMVIEVIQKRAPERTMVMMPGTHPNTLRDQVCAMMARQTWSPASNHAAFCQVMVRSLMSCLWLGQNVSQDSYAEQHTYIESATCQPSLQTSQLIHGAYLILTFSNQRRDGGMAIVIGKAVIAHHRLLLIVVVRVLHGNRWRLR